MLAAEGGRRGKVCGGGVPVKASLSKTFCSNLLFLAPPATRFSTATCLRADLTELAADACAWPPPPPLLLFFLLLPFEANPLFCPPPLTRSRAPASTSPISSFFNRANPNLPVGASEACRLPLPACFLMPDAPDLNLLPPPGDELRSESNLPISDTAAREICRISDGDHFLLPAATATSAASPR